MVAYGVEPAGHPYHRFGGGEDRLLILTGVLDGIGWWTDPDWLTTQISGRYYFVAYGEYDVWVMARPPGLPGGSTPRRWRPDTATCCRTSGSRRWSSAGNRTRWSPSRASARRPADSTATSLSSPVATVSTRNTGHLSPRLCYRFPSGRPASSSVARVTPGWTSIRRSPGRTSSISFMRTSLCHRHV
jgi:hypothetical protein